MERICTWNAVAAHEKRLTISTALTCIRIFLTPIIVGMICQHAWQEALILFILAACTDVLDGALARALGQQTAIGAWLDPIADKFLLIACFFALALSNNIYLIIPTWFVWAIFIKELLVMGGTCLLYICKKPVMIMPTLLSKISTFLQFCFIAWLFICHFFSWVPSKTYYVLLTILVCFIAATLLEYARIGLHIWQSNKAS